MPRLKAPLPRLTERQREILKHILTYYVKNLSYPTKSQVCKHFGRQSRNTTAMLRPLFQKGDLTDLRDRGQYEISPQGIQRLQTMGVDIPEELLEEEQRTLQLTN